MSAERNSRVWFYYVNDEQVGPMTFAELREAILSGVISSENYVYRESFPDWKLLGEIPELHPDRLGAMVKKSSREKRMHKRVAIQERVVAHNDEKIASGSLSDISLSGIFLTTQTRVFSINDEVKVTVKEGRGLGKPMHLRGIVVRQSEQGASGFGYGIELKHLDPKTRQSIINYVKSSQNQNG